MVAAQVHAGPPLVTDDTGIVNEGGWEFIGWVAGEVRDAGKSYDAPGLEASFGIGNGMQLTAAVARQVEDPEGESSKSDLGYGSVAWKWRFYESDAVALATGVAYAFPTNGSAKRRGLIEDIRILSVPLIASYATGDWEFTGQVSYDLTSVSEDGLFYGAWAGYGATENLTLLAEVYGESVLGSSARIANWRLGAEYGLGRFGTLLAAYGGKLSSDLPPEEELDYDFFVGWQYETE